MTWDTAKNRYYMVVAGVDGNPLNYVHETTLASRMDVKNNKVPAFLDVKDEASELKKLSENMNIKCVETALLNAAK